MAYLQREDDLSVQYQLAAPSISIGRAQNNDIVLDGDMRVSRHHARLNLDEGQWVLVDSQSANGTTVNGQRVTTHSLRSGDRVRIGNTSLVFVPVADPLATITEQPPAVEAKVPVLSAREREILALLGAGRTDREIADTLYISVATVRSHLDRIRDKTGCRRRPELTRFAMELNIR